MKAHKEMKLVVVTKCQCICDNSFSAPPLWVWGGDVQVPWILAFSTSCVEECHLMSVRYKYWNWLNVKRITD